MICTLHDCMCAHWNAKGGIFKGIELVQCHVESNESHGSEEMLERKEN